MTTTADTDDTNPRLAALEADVRNINVQLERVNTELQESRREQQESRREQQAENRAMRAEFQAEIRQTNAKIDELSAQVNPGKIRPDQRQDRRPAPRSTARSTPYQDGVTFT